MSPVEDTLRSTQDAYPADLARFIRASKCSVSAVRSPAGYRSSRRVARALDVEADVAVEESVGGVGTRHRSAYRLCNELRDVIAVVISQDGNVRFVKRKDEAVTYWDQA